MSESCAINPPLLSALTIPTRQCCPSFLEYSTPSRSPGGGSNICPLKGNARENKAKISALESACDPLIKVFKAAATFYKRKTWARRDVIPEPSSFWASDRQVVCSEHNHPCMMSCEPVWAFTAHVWHWAEQPFPVITGAERYLRESREAHVISLPGLVLRLNLPWCAVEAASGPVAAVVLPAAAAFTAAFLTLLLLISFASISDWVSFHGVGGL